MNYGETFDKDNKGNIKKYDYNKLKTIISQNPTYIILEELIDITKDKIYQLLNDNNYINQLQGWKIDENIFISKKVITKLFLFSLKDNYNVFKNIELSGLKLKYDKINGKLFILTPDKWSTCVNIGKSFFPIAKLLDKELALKYYNVLAFRGGGHAFFSGNNLIVDPALKRITTKDNLNYGFCGFWLDTCDLKEEIEVDEHIILKKQSFVLGTTNIKNKEYVFSIGLNENSNLFIESWPLNGNEKELYYYQGDITNGDEQKEFSKIILKKLKQKILII